MIYTELQYIQYVQYVQYVCRYMFLRLYVHCVWLRRMRVLHIYFTVRCRRQHRHRHHHPQHPHRHDGKTRMANKRMGLDTDAHTHT